MTGGSNYNKFVVMRMLVGCFIACSIFPIVSQTPDLYQKNYGLTSVQAGQKYGMINLLQGITFILVGLFNDAYGRIGLV